MPSLPSLFFQHPVHRDPAMPPILCYCFVSHCQTHLIITDCVGSSPDIMEMEPYRDWAEEAHAGHPLTYTAVGIFSLLH